MFLSKNEIQSFSFVSTEGMYGYHGQRSLDFLRITMAMPRLIAPAKRLLEQGFKFGPFPVQSYQAYEANIDFEIRLVWLNFDHFILLEKAPNYSGNICHQDNIGFFSSFTSHRMESLTRYYLQ